MEDAIATILQALNLPTWVVLLLVVTLGVASLFAGRFPAWVGPLITALRIGAMAVLRRPAKLAVTKAKQRVAEPAKVEPSGPRPVDESGGAPPPPATWETNTDPDEPIRGG